MTTEQTLDISPEAKQQVEEAANLLSAAEAYKVTDQESFDAAGEALIELKRVENELTQKRLNMTRPLDRSKAAIMEFFRGPIDRIARARSLYSRGRLAWTTEQERKRQEAEARLRESQRKEAERLAKRAAAAEEKGQTEKAEALREQAEATPVPTVAPSVQATAGVSQRKNYRAEVTDKMALIKAVAEGKVPDVVLVADMKVLNAQARALKDNMAYPGVKAVYSLSEAVRA